MRHKFVLSTMFLIGMVFGSSAQVQSQNATFPKGERFGNYRGIDIIIPDTDRKAQTGIIIPDFDRKAKPLQGQTTLTGTVTRIGDLNCENQKCTANSIDVKRADGSIATIGTNDFDFAVPREIKGRKISVEGFESSRFVRERKVVQKDYQRGLQFVATGIMIID